MVVNWESPTYKGIVRIQYYGSSGHVVAVAERPMPVTLTLTREEAETLLIVTRLIAGDRRHTRRRHTDAIQMRLENAGVSYQTDDEGLIPRGIYVGNISFKQ